MAWALIENPKRHDVTGFHPDARQRATPDGRRTLLFPRPRSCYPVRDHRRRAPCQDRRTSGKRRPLSMSRDSTSEAGRGARAKAAGRLGRQTHERAMNRRAVTLGLVSMVAAWPSCSHAQSPPRDSPPRLVWKEIPKIVILSTEDDSRVPAVREAIDFWNAELSQLGSAFRLGTTSHSLRTISTDDLRAYIATPRVLNAFSPEQHQGSER